MMRNEVILLYGGIGYKEGLAHARFIAKGKEFLHSSYR